MNRKSDAWGHFPTRAPVLEADSTISREITVFNDEFTGSDIKLIWEVREGSNSNWVFDRGSKELTIKPGFMAKSTIKFRTPIFNTYIFLTLKVIKDGVVRFVDELTCYEVTGGKDFRSEFNDKEREFK